MLGVDGVNVDDGWVEVWMLCGWWMMDVGGGWVKVCMVDVCGR